MRSGATAGLASALRAVPGETARPGREDRSRPNKRMQLAATACGSRSPLQSAERLAAAPHREQDSDLQACPGPEFAFDEANSSSRTSPRYVSMTFTSAAQTGTDCPRLSSTNGSPSGDAFGAGAACPAEVAMRRPDRRCSRAGGPRQLRGSVPVARMVSVATSAGRVRSASRQLVRTTTSAAWFGFVSARSDASQFHPALTASRTREPSAAQLLATACRRATAVMLLAGLVLNDPSVV